MACLRNDPPDMQGSIFLHVLLDHYSVKTHEKKVRKRETTMDKKIKQKLLCKIILCIIVAVASAMLIAYTAFLLKNIFKNPQPEIISKSTLEKIINVSDLSTFEAVYNGIAKVVNEENQEKVDYYVSYDAKVKAGIDFEKVEITIDDENKVISIKLPKIKLTDINVDITSLDYIFENDKANTPTVAEQAYKKCIEDVTNESSSENAIYELAEQNAKNIIEALVRPFIEQLDAEYQLQID